MFSHVIDRLAKGHQPDPKMVNDIGYVMRTTAVYGNGKFGISDRAAIADRPAMLGPFQAEMLTVYLIRHFSLALIDYLAAIKGGEAATKLRPDLARHFGIGNATGLGMAPFLVHHQVLLHHWMEAREKALARVLAQPRINAEQAEHIRRLVARAQSYTAQWRVDDQVQMDRIVVLADDLKRLGEWVSASWGDGPNALADLMTLARAELSLEAEEMLVSILLEPFGDLIDDLGDTMAAHETSSLDVTATVAAVIDQISTDYDWALSRDLNDRFESELFWYVSEAKLEPRLGHRYEEDGADQEMPFDIPHQIQALYPDLQAVAPDMLLAEFMLKCPQHRLILRRVLNTRHYPYSEIRDNLVAGDTRPIDMLRCKLSFFGASKFDPKSDLWTRITLYQGAPLAQELNDDSPSDWLFSTLDLEPA